LYWASPTAAALRDRIPWIEGSLAGHGKGGVLVVVSKDAGGALPSQEFRAESRAQAKRYGDSILFSATVIEGNAIRDSLLRAFLRGLAVMVGQDSIELRFFEQAPPAIAWASELAKPFGGPTVDELTEALATLRARRAHPPLLG
jgi:hypothetical protein